MKNSTNITAASGAPVRRSDLSEHVLYDLDASDWFQDSEYEEDDSTDEERAEREAAERAAYEAERAANPDEMPF